MVFIAPNPPRIPASRASASRSPARWGTLSLALGAGLAAALLAFLLVRSHTPAGAAAPDTLSVVVALRAIPARTRLAAGLLQVRSLSVTDVPEGAVAHPDSLLGKITVQAIPAGAAVTQSALAAPGAASGLAFALPPSQRAVTVAVDPADGVEEFAYPGDHVDILATDEPGSGPAETRTVLQNVSLLAVGAQTSADAPAASPPPAAGVSHVTVAVSPAQAQALVLAEARGKIHLALRPAGEEAVEAVSPFPAPPVPAAQNALRSAIHSAPPRPRARPHPRAVRVATPDPLPPIPLSPLPVIAPPHPAAVTITVIKGSQSQTVSVAP